MNGNQRIDTMPNLPEIFRTVLNQRGLMVEDETIVDFILLQRDGKELMARGVDVPKDWQPATLVIATNYSLIALQDGGIQIAEDFVGYHITHVPYDKICGIILDGCLLDGELRVLTPCAEGGLTVKFNTAHYHQHFERFVGNLRKLVMRCSGCLGN